MESLYLSSIPLMQDIQSRFVDHENVLTAINQLSDPTYAFSIIIPIISTFNTLLTADILMVSVIAEWSNCLLKWFIKEDRPYWWIREANIKKLGYPYLKQGPLTCETGPGSPSGHLMGCAAVLYVLINTCIKYYSARNERAGRGNNKLLAFVFWGAYIVALVFVSISRMFAATHFPHQCVLGAILGFLIGHYFGNTSQKLTNYWHNCTKLRLFVFVFLATLISVAAYWLQKAMGIDPQWSVKMAFKWCEHIEYVHVNTTPLFSLVRDTGLGFGLVAVSPVINKGTKHNLMVSVACVLFYCTALHMAQTAVPVYDAKTFYLCHTLLNSTMPFILIGVIPRIATLKRKTH